VIAVTLAVVVAAAGPVRGVCYGLLVLAGAAAAGLYRPRIGGRVSDQAGRLAGAAALPVLALLPWTLAGTAMRLAGSAVGLLIGVRAATAASQRSARRRGLLMQQTLIIGAGQAGHQVYRLLREHPELGLRPCGALDNRAAASEQVADWELPGGGLLATDGHLPGGGLLASDGVLSGGGPEAAGRALPVLGRIATTAAVLARFDVSQVLVCAPAATDAELAAALRECRERGVRVSVLPQLPELGLAVPRACLDEIWGTPFVPVRPDADDLGRRAATRVLDLSVGPLLFLATAPLMLALALAAWLDLRLPPLFRQVRVVGRGRLATIAKLRTLRPAGDPDTTWAVSSSQSSRLGRLLRRTHADELPQLASVVRGDMALVGPRPERPHFAFQLRRSVSGYAAREQVRAGLTGWAQVHGLTGDTSIEDRARLDNFYIEYWSIWLDLLILARTGLAALSGVLTKGGTR
jgi:lipopolysaccharide/colanic/teichoic acid biosynthesis glycosyltransferase